MTGASRSVLGWERRAETIRSINATLAEVWCANDDRPAVAEVMTTRNDGKAPERRALCGDCYWKAQAGAKVNRSCECGAIHAFADYGPCTKPDGHTGHHGNAQFGWPS